MPPVNKTKEKTPQEIEREKQQELALGRQVKILEKRLEALKPSNFNPDSLRTQEDSLYSSLDFKLKLVRDKDGFFPPEFRKGKADELDFEIRKRELFLPPVPSQPDSAEWKSLGAQGQARLFSELLELGLSELKKTNIKQPEGRTNLEFSYPEYKDVFSGNYTQKDFERAQAIRRSPPFVVIEGKRVPAVPQEAPGYMMVHIVSIGTRQSSENTYLHNKEGKKKIASLRYNGPVSVSYISVNGDDPKDILVTISQNPGVASINADLIFTRMYDDEKKRYDLRINKKQDGKNGACYVLKLFSVQDVDPELRKIEHLKIAEITISQGDEFYAKAKEIYENSVSKARELLYK